MKSLFYFTSHDYSKNHGQISAWSGLEHPELAREGSKQFTKGKVEPDEYLLAKSRRMYGAVDLNSTACEK